MVSAVPLRDSPSNDRAGRGLTSSSSRAVYSSEVFWMMTPKDASSLETVNVILD